MPDREDGGRPLGAAGSRPAVAIDESLVRALVAEAFPEWTDLPVRAVVPGGNDNRTFRLGEDLVVRLPSAHRYAAAVAKEQRWLPELGRALPLPVPVPVAAGRPTSRFPWPWSVNRWLPGTAARADGIPDPDRFARDLASFLLALQGVDTAGAPHAGRHNFHRGGDLAVYEGETQRALARLDPAEAAWAAALWSRARRTRWTREPVWVHGDVADGNLLVADGRLSSVIDFGGCGVGDPASDLVIAWVSFDRRVADVFAASLGHDAETWARAAGWALWKALIMLDGEQDAEARRTLGRLHEGLPQR